VITTHELAIAKVDALLGRERRLLNGSTMLNYVRAQMFPSIYLGSPPRSKLLTAHRFKVAISNSGQSCNDEVFVCRRVRRCNVAQYRNIENRTISCAIEYNKF
jgi:hypothetical protein